MPYDYSANRAGHLLLNIPDTFLMPVFRMSISKSSLRKFPNRNKVSSISNGIKSQAQLRYRCCYHFATTCSFSFRFILCFVLLHIIFVYANYYPIEIEIQIQIILPTDCEQKSAFSHKFMGDCCNYFPLLQSIKVKRFNNNNPLMKKKMNKFLLIQIDK